MVQVFTNLSSYASGENEKNGGESNSIITSKSLNYPIFFIFKIKFRSFLHTGIRASCEDCLDMAVSLQIFRTDRLWPAMETRKWVLFYLHPDVDVHIEI